MRFRVVVATLYSVNFFLVVDGVPVFVSCLLGHRCGFWPFILIR